MAENYGLVEYPNQEELIMNKIQQKQFFELMEEIKTISENINTIAVDDKIWKIQLQFSSIRELLRQAETLLKLGFNDEEVVR